MAIDGDVTDSRDNQNRVQPDANLPPPNGPINPPPGGNPSGQGEGLWVPAEELEAFHAWKRAEAKGKRVALAEEDDNQPRSTPTTS